MEANCAYSQEGLIMCSCRCMFPFLLILSVIGLFIICLTSRADKKVDNNIYFEIGFKSYDITISRTKLNLGSIGLITERSKNFIRRVSLNRKTLE